MPPSRTRLRATFNIDEEILRRADREARDGKVSRSRAIEIVLAERWGLPLPAYPEADGPHGGGRPRAPSNASATGGDEDADEPASEQEDGLQPGSSRSSVPPQRRGKQDDEGAEKNDDQLGLE